MKLKIISIAFLLVFFQVSTLAPAAAPARPWLSRVVPLAFNKDTGEWNVLLSHNVSDDNDTWSDFGLPGQRDRDNVQEIAQRALAEQTNNKYNVELSDIANAPSARDNETGDVYHFVIVPYKTGKELYQSGRNQIKDDYAWLSAETIIVQDTGANIAHRTHSKPIEHQFHEFFKKEWSEIKPKLKEPTLPVMTKGSKQ